MKQRLRILPLSERKAFAHRQWDPCTLTCKPIAVQQALHVDVQALPCPTYPLNRQCVLHVNVQGHSTRRKGSMHVNVQALPCPSSLLYRQCALHVDVQRPSPVPRAVLHVNVQSMTARASLHVNVQGHSTRRKGSMHVDVQGPLDTEFKGRLRIPPHQNTTDKDLGPGKPPGPKSFWRPEMD